MTIIESLAVHARWRDADEIPVLFPSRSSRASAAYRQRLKELCRDLHGHYSAIDFLRPRLLTPSSLAAGALEHRKASRYDMGVSVAEELLDLESRCTVHQVELARLMQLQQALAACLLGSTLPDICTPHEPVERALVEPRILLRAFSERSHSPYSRNLGFRCSNSDTLPDAADFAALLRSRTINEDTLRDHFHNNALPSKLISMIDDPRWLLDDSPHSKVDRALWNVAFLNVGKMRRLGVLLQRSDLLLTQAGIQAYSTEHKDGIKFTWCRHWVAYDWIPPQCIEEVVSAREFAKRFTARHRPGTVFRDPPEGFLTRQAPESAEVEELILPITSIKME